MWDDSVIPAAAGDTGDRKTMVADSVVVVPDTLVVFRDGEVVDGMRASRRSQGSTGLRRPHRRVTATGERRRRTPVDARRDRTRATKTSDPKIRVSAQGQI